jgi:hypothetical protein
MEVEMLRETGAKPLWLRQWKPRMRCSPDFLGVVATESETLGCTEPDGPGVGLEEFFLIHIKELEVLKFLPRPAVDGDGSEEADRRRRG